MHCPNSDPLIIGGICGGETDLDMGGLYINKGSQDYFSEEKQGVRGKVFPLQNTMIIFSSLLEDFILHVSS